MPMDHQFGPISDSSLQAAQAQAAHLRALHSAVLNSARISAQAAAAAGQISLPGHHYRHGHSNSIHELLGGLRIEDLSVTAASGVGVASTSAPAPLDSTILSPSTSSIADCAIRPPHEYPVFNPSHDDLHVPPSQTDAISASATHPTAISAHRNSFDHSDFQLREERLQYILDHENRSSAFPNKPGSIKSAARNLFKSGSGSSAEINLAAPPANNWITSIHPLNKEGAAGTGAPLIKTANYLHHYTTKARTVVGPDSDAGRQKALSEYLTEEIARRKALKELAAVDTTAAAEAMRNKNAVIAGINHAIKPVSKDNGLAATAGGGDAAGTGSGTGDGGVKPTKFAPEASVSCDKCRPVGSGVVSQKPVVGDSVLKERFKLGWFSRGKKKGPRSSSARSMTSSDQLNAMDTSSQVCSSLINGVEAEKELEAAMAMDLMELKVMQANATRDAAMAEMSEMRAAMESMGKKLEEVERNCLELRSQLADVRESESEAGGGRAFDELDMADFDRSEMAASVSDFDTASMFSERQRPGSGGSRSSAAMISGGVSRSAGMVGCAGSYREQQPSKADFCSAVSEARVCVKQLCRVLAQIMQAERGAAVKEMVEEKLRGSGYAGAAAGGGRGLRYQLEAVANAAFYEHFENVGFDRSGCHKVLEPSQRALAFYHGALKLAKLTCTQLLAQASPLYDAAFDLFCARKMRAVGRAVGCPARFWPDELTRLFLAAARAVWILHHVAFAFHVSAPAPSIFRVAASTPFDARFMEALPVSHGSRRQILAVSYMVMPGFYVQDDVIKSKVVAS